MLAQLISLGQILLARVLDRAFEEAHVVPEVKDLSWQTFFTTLDLPIEWVVRKMDDRQEMSKVREMYREFKLTGRVEAKLPDDVRVVRDLFAAHQATKSLRSAEIDEVFEEKAIETPSTEIPEEVAEVASLEAEETPTFERSTTPAASRSLANLGSLSGSDEVVSAPSIGQRTADRLNAIDVHTVADFSLLIQKLPQTSSMRTTSMPTPFALGRLNPR